MASHVATTTLFLLLLSCAPTSFSGHLYTDSIPPNFTASNFQFIDQSGVFLASLNRTFTAAIVNPQPQSSSFYLVVLHAASNTVVWAANRNIPISNSAELRLSSTSLAIYNDSGEPIWSTPPFNSSVAALQLKDSGSLVLVDKFNSTLWDSFNHPTDTIVTGQRLRAGGSLIGAANKGEMSSGDYEFVVTAGDAMLQWHGLTYWKLSMDTRSSQNSNLPVSDLAITNMGLYLFGNRESDVAFQVTLPPENSDFKIARLGYDGRFSVMRFSGNNWVPEFIAPLDGCDIPLICGQIGLCSTGVCSCPPGFHAVAGNCRPSDSSLSLPSSCGSNFSQSQSNNYSYIMLGPGMDYFYNDFTQPFRNGVHLSTCEDLCSGNCSCLGIFYGNDSGACYLLENYLGSIMSASSSGGSDRLGYIKVIVTNQDANENRNQKSNFPIAGLVLLPSSGVFLIFIAILWFKIRRRRKRLAMNKSLGRWNYSEEEELEIFSIPGLPVRFDYQELVDATENFGNLIGSGGFGNVYKGTLRDKTVVAVKKITSLGVQGKKEFCTEIAIIGNVHHVNLVRLKGFCALGRERFLVYEYMNRGSLDQTLFGNGPVLEWQERFEIALGTARGLNYLHSGCDHKIIHCDVKPENILLHDNFQVKISDFGLSKLLSPEQSGLFTTMRGTRGYLAPEWLTSSTISDKTDVYSYGMVLLELVRGRKNCALQASSHSLESGSSSTGGNSSSLVSRNRLRPMYFPLHALEMHEEGRYLELVEPRLEGRVTREEVEKLVRVALCCVHEEPMLRPTMANVVGMLEGVFPLGEPRTESLNFLRFYGRRFTEASTIEGGGDVGQNEFMLYTQADATINSSTSASPNSCSYMSSHQVSGPR